MGPERLDGCTAELGEFRREQRGATQLLGQRLKLKGEVDRRTDDREIVPVRRAYIAVYDLARMERRAEAQLGQSRRLAPEVEGIDIGLRFGHRFQGDVCPLGRAVVVDAEDGQKSVAGEFQDFAAARRDRPARGVEEIVQGGDDLALIPRVGIGREAAQVAGHDDRSQGLARAAHDGAVEHPAAGVAAGRLGLQNRREDRQDVGEQRDPVLGEAAGPIGRAGHRVALPAAELDWMDDVIRRVFGLEVGQNRKLGQIGGRFERAAQRQPLLEDRAQGLRIYMSEPMMPCSRPTSVPPSVPRRHS